MHKQNIAHRDIKPENILIVPEEGVSAEYPNVKLTDFGFATFFKKQTGMTQVLGSPLYMAPEVVQERQYDEKVDVWSVGVITHILLCGAPPFFGRSTPEIYQSIIQDQPKFGRYLSRLSEASVDFTMKMLQKDPSKRASAAELLQNPWLQSQADESNITEEDAEAIMSDLVAFQKQNVFQTGVLSLLTQIKVQ